MFSVSYPVVAGLAARWNQDWLKERSYALMNADPLKTAKERALHPKDYFKECTDCPEMIVVPAGSHDGLARDRKGPL